MILSWASTDPSIGLRSGDQRGGLVGDGEAGEDVVVEVVAAEQQVVDRGEELAALGALDDAVVVGARERDGLADADLGERLRDRRLRTRAGR